MKTLIAALSALVAFGVAGLAAAQPPAGGMPGMQAVRAACADDFAKLCPDAKTRDDRRQCMMQNHDKFSDTCKAALAEMRQKMQQANPTPSPAPGDR